MATAADFLIFVGADEWDARVYQVLSSASNLALAVKRRSNTLRIAYHLHKLNGTLKGMLEEVYAVLEGKKHVEPVQEPVTPQRLRQSSDNLERISRMIEALYESGRRAGLTNNSLTAGPLDAIRKHIPELLDVAEWFEAAADSEQVNSAFARAREESKNGDIYDLSQVE